MERTSHHRTQVSHRPWQNSTPVTVAVDSAAWFVLHMLIAFGATLLPRGLFSEKQWLFRTRRWEKGGMLYERLLDVGVWKRLLPDGSRLFRGGFTKKHMRGNDPAYLLHFVQETCRAEAAHWIVIAVAPLFFLWNPRRVGVFMIFYALAANLPCIVVQRYNRPRLKRVAERMVKAPGGAAATPAPESRAGATGPVPTPN